MVARFLFVCLALAVLAPRPGVHGAMTKSKLSIHTSMGDRSWAVLHGGQPRVVKLLDSFGQAPAIKQAVPGIVVVGRIYLSSQPQTGDPSQAAQAWLSQVKNTIMNSPGVDYWEGYNEPSVGDSAGLQWYTQFEVARVKLLSALGVKASIGQFGVGTPDITNISLVEIFNPAIDAARAAGGILGVHEYSSPTMQGCFDNATGEGWTTGRYRKWYRQILRPQNRVLPLVISESGIDNSPCDNSPNYGGWNKYCAFWAAHYGSTNCAQTYISQLAWYDSILRGDSFVIGATIFQLEIGGWAGYDLAFDNADQALTAYLKASQQGEP